MSFITEKKWLCRILFLEFVIVAAYCNAKLCVAYTEIMLAVWSLFGLAEIIIWVRKRRKYKKAPRWWVFYKCMDMWFGQALALMFAISLCFGVISVADYAEKRMKYNKITVAEAEEVLIKHQGKSILEHADVLEQLSPELYRNLSLQEKANVLGRMIQIEAEYLGIETPALQIRVLDGSTVGYYIKEENLVLLNENYLPYYLQEMENTAREYAEKRLEEYGKLIVLGNTP